MVFVRKRIKLHWSFCLKYPKVHELSWVSPIQRKRLVGSGWSGEHIFFFCGKMESWDVDVSVLNNACWNSMGFHIRYCFCLTWASVFKECVLMSIRHSDLVPWHRKWLLWYTLMALKIVFLVRKWIKGHWRFCLKCPNVPCTENGQYDIFVVFKWCFCEKVDICTVWLLFQNMSLRSYANVN